MSDSTDKPTGRAALDAELASYGSRTASMRLCDALLKALPGAPPLEALESLDAAIAAEGVSGAVAERARALADVPEVDRALFAAKSIDTGDTGITILTGVRTALSLFLGDKGPGAGADTQQRADAALKALGIAYLVSQLIPREPAQRVVALETLPAGRALLLYYAAVEVVLPLGDAVRAGDGRFVQTLVEAQSRHIAGKLLGVIGREGVSDAQQTLAALIGRLDATVLEVLPHGGGLADALKNVLPKALGSHAQAIGDVVAAGADALPIYRLLCAQLAAETRIALARWEADPASEPVAAPEPVPEAEGAPDTGASADPDAVPAADPAAASEPVAAPPGPPAVPAGLAGLSLGIDPSTSPTEAAPAPASAAPEAARGEHDLGGVYQHAEPWGVLWLVFTRAGVFSNHPPDRPDADWVAHAEAGHQVGTYQHRAGTLVIRWPDGRETTSTLERESTAMVVDGTRCQRCDWNLDGCVLDGTWVDRADGTRWRFARDGRFARDQVTGRYTLGVGALRLVDGGGGEVAWSLYSTLDPDPESPLVLWIGGRPCDRAAR